MQQTNANSVLKSFSKVCKKHWLKCSSVCKILQKTIQKAHLNVGHAYLYVIKMVWKLRRRDLQKAHLMVPLLPDLLRQKCQQICFCHPPGPFLYPEIFAKSAQDLKMILLNVESFFPDAIFTCPYLCSLWGMGTKILHNFGHKTVWIGFETFGLIFIIRTKEA